MELGDTFTAQILGIWAMLLKNRSLNWYSTWYYLQNLRKNFSGLSASPRGPCWVWDFFWGWSDPGRSLVCGCAWVPYAWRCLRWRRPKMDFDWEIHAQNFNEITGHQKQQHETYVIPVIFFGTVLLYLWLLNTKGSKPSSFEKCVTEVFLITEVFLLIQKLHLTFFKQPIYNKSRIVVQTLQPPAPWYRSNMKDI